MAVNANGAVALNVKRIGHLDIPGGGQVVVQGKRAYVGHIDPPHGTSIVDVSDVTKPKILSTLEVANYHPPVDCSTHTYARMPLRLDGKDIAVVVDEEPGRARAGHIPGFMWGFDVTDETKPAPLSAYFMSEQDTP